ncbi:MAG TPA: hypothetical protein VI076_15260 [Actinopolymorphaceae bacterium]
MSFGPARARTGSLVLVALVASVAGIGVGYVGNDLLEDRGDPASESARTACTVAARYGDGGGAIAAMERDGLDATWPALTVYGSAMSAAADDTSYERLATESKGLSSGIAALDTDRVGAAVDGVLRECGRLGY